MGSLYRKQKMKVEAKSMGREMKSIPEPHMVNKEEN